MRVLRLPAVPQFRDRPLLTLRNEDRVVAEALAPTGFFRDPTLERAGAAKLAAVRRKGDELRDVAGAALLHAVELAQQLRNGRSPLGRVARRLYARPAAERLDLEPRVLGEHPPLYMFSAEPGFEHGVLVVRRARLGRVVVPVERIERPAREEPFELPRLVPVARAEDGAH
jgi:hypothetical protein